jgi:methylglutaconyl-CoA hydratase
MKNNSSNINDVGEKQHMSLIEIERDAAGVATVWLNRPDKRNALNLALLEELKGALGTLENEKNVRVLVLRGRGSTFCAGLDLAEAQDPTQAHRSAELIAAVLESIYEWPGPTLAVVHGAALAGGAGLMSACDLVLATVDCRIGYPEVRRGLVAALVMTLLRRQIGDRAARELLLLGEIMEAERAQALGLVTRVVPSDLLEDTCALILDALLQGAPGAHLHTKRLWNAMYPRLLRDDLALALEKHVEIRRSQEAQEGMRAFLEKRPPNWAQ